MRRKEKSDDESNLHYGVDVAQGVEQVIYYSLAPGVFIRVWICVKDRKHLGVEKKDYLNVLKNEMCLIEHFELLSRKAL